MTSVSSTRARTPRRGRDSVRERSRRAERYSARRVLHELSSLPRVRACGHHGIMPDGNVAVKLTGDGADRKAGFSGLASCGSTWACPVCSHKIAVSRAEDLGNAIKRWQALGGLVLMLTLTMRHRNGQRLLMLWDALAHAWGKVTSGRGWKRDQADYGVMMPRVIKSGARKGEVVTERRIGFVRVVETTVGENGWHIHIHCLLFVRGDITGGEAIRLGQSIFGRWLPALTGKGLTAPSLRHGVDIRPVKLGEHAVLGDYFSKAQYSADQAGFEVAAGQGKTGGRGNRTPFQLLADVLALGDADDLARWWEWEEASHNRRQLTWSAGLREYLAMGEEKTEAEIVEEELGGDVVLTLTAEQFAAVRPVAEAVLDAFEVGGAEHGTKWVDSYLRRVYSGIHEHSG